MTKVIINETTLYNIGNAIRTKNSSTTLYKPSDFANAIESLKSGKYAPRINLKFENYAGTELDNEIYNLDTCNMDDMSSMFNGCPNLINLDLSNFDTSKVKDMNHMCYKCSKLKSINISNFITNNVTNISYIFNGCKSLMTIDMSSFDLGKVNNVNGAFSNCSGWLDLKFGYDFGKGFVQKTNNYSAYSLSFWNYENLSHDGIMSIINGLYDLNLTYDVANGGTLYTQTLSLGSANLAKLTAEELVIGTAKGWSIS